MKNLILPLIMALVWSCSDDDGGGVVDDGLEGEWILTNVSCFCDFGENPNFRATNIVFDIENNEVEVNNTGENDYFRRDGTYKYTGNGNELTFSNGRSYIFAINGTELSLVFIDEPNIADDEISYSFIRR